MPAARSAQLSFADSLPSRRRSLISLTPLIDVVFILLIFFMLASSFADWRAIGLSTPAGEGGGDPLTGAVLVDVRQDSIRLSGLPVSRRALTDGARKHLEQTPDRLFIVRPAPGVPLQRAVDVMDSLSAAGARRISLAEGGGP